MLLQPVAVAQSTIITGAAKKLAPAAGCGIFRVA